MKKTTLEHEKNKKEPEFDKMKEEEHEK